MTKLLVQVNVYGTQQTDEGLRIDAEPQQAFIVNHHNPEGRRRLAKCARWAYRTGRAITTFCITPEASPLESVDTYA